MTSAKYRGRPVTENTLQDYVNELVKKYIQSNIPQWQVLIIPISGDVSIQLYETSNVRASISNLEPLAPN